VARLKSSDNAAIAAMSTAVSAGAGAGAAAADPLVAAKAELDQIEAVMADLKAREEELKAGGLTLVHWYTGPLVPPFSVLS